MDAKKKNNGQKSDTNSSDPYLFSVAAFDKPLSLRTLAISERHTRHSTRVVLFHQPSAGKRESHAGITGGFEGCGGGNDN